MHNIYKLQTSWDSYFLYEDLQSYVNERESEVKYDDKILIIF
jgi:hypothetical protein